MEKRSASHPPSPMLLHAAFFLLCLLLPPDVLFILLTALHLFMKEHTLSVSPCWYRSGLPSVQKAHDCFLGLVETPS